MASPGSSTCITRGGNLCSDVEDLTRTMELLALFTRCLHIPDILKDHALEKCFSYFSSGEEFKVALNSVLPILNICSAWP
jgi:hypothetical protein